MYVHGRRNIKWPITSIRIIIYVKAITHEHPNRYQGHIFVDLGPDKTHITKEDKPLSTERT
jgi:hypothetical protein